jgi:hypothetical protein
MMGARGGNQQQPMEATGVQQEIKKAMSTCKKIMGDSLIYKNTLVALKQAPDLQAGYFQQQNGQ